MTARSANGWRRRTSEPRLRLIAATVAEMLGISMERLMGRDRSHAVSRARQLAHLIARQITTRSSPDIGFHIGGVEHGVVLHGARKAEERLKQDAGLRERHERIRALIDERHAAEMAARPKVQASSAMPQAAAVGGAP